MAIEQCLMRLLKIQGGLTNGCGISNSQLAYFVLAFPACIKVCEAMERLIGVSMNSTEHYVELGDSRQSVDKGDSETVLPLAAVNNSITIRIEVVSVNLQQLFMPIVWAVINSAGDLLHYLKNELAPRPLALFDDVSMWKTDKSALLDVFNSAPVPEILQETSTFIIDCGYLFQVLVWPRPPTFGTVVESYLQRAVQHYFTSAIVIFDGYDDVLSTKAEEQRRCSLHKTSPIMSFDSSTIIIVSQADFLSNGHNKARLISMLSQEFHSAGLKVHQAVADTDTLIVRTVLQEATKGREVIVVATDSHILIMLLARAHGGTSVHLLSPGSKIYSVGDIQRQIVFNNPSADKGQIITAGEQFLIQLYNNEDFRSLDELCGRMYARPLARQAVTASFELAALPPTSAAQPQDISAEWLDNRLCPTDWGCIVSGKSLIPVATELPPAPDDLLQLISCACKAECATNCCCHTTDLSSSMMCAHCSGRGCHKGSNSEHHEDTPDAPDGL
ncbi:hypothetical protein PR048_024094 [Dryococelus australis]|uniref:Uncharacterized protein n=1 Tax=Dryococelus australis TaxID=614101 RepID=A0ABQ9GVX2_9NEOP|nr:hypothetical protein PR048_024094 [Dryococelus australis]